MSERKDAVRACRFSMLRRLMATGAAVAVLGLAAGTTEAATLLDDFESDFAGMTGTLTESVPVAIEQRPNQVAGMRIATAGTGACSNMIGSSKALCGADTLKWAGFDGAILRYGVTFGGFAALAFDLGAWSIRDPFDPYDGDKPDEWGDYVRVQAEVGGITTLLAEFTGTREDGLQQGLVSTSAGQLLGAGVVVDAHLRTFTLSGLHKMFEGSGALVFQFRTTGSAEQIGIDNIRLLPVPLPGTLPLLLLGLGAMGAARVLRRG